MDYIWNFLKNNFFNLVSFCFVVGIVLGVSWYKTQKLFSILVILFSIFFMFLGHILAPTKIEIPYWLRKNIFNIYIFFVLVGIFSSFFIMIIKRRGIDYLLILYQFIVGWQFIRFLAQRGSFAEILVLKNVTFLFIFLGVIRYAINSIYKK